MRSSTSSSERVPTSMPRHDARLTIPERSVPPRRWLAAAAIALLLATAGVAAREIAVRRAGFGPTYAQTADLWVMVRRQVEPHSLVAIGSSRMNFDLDLDVFEELVGRRPLQLAQPGSSPRPVLHELASDESFRGTLLVGVTPPLFFAPGGPPLARGAAATERLAKQSPSQRLGHWLGMRLEARLASLNTDLRLRGILERLPLPPRPGHRPLPTDPPYFGHVAADREMSMVPRLEHDAEYQRRIQAVWQGHIDAVPPMPPEAVAQAREMVLTAVAADVAKLRARGVALVFVRFPSTGPLREAERRMTPRADYWDALLARTGAPGIHFEDHPELAHFDCPEWSHLSDGDAARFTRALVPLLAPYLSPPTAAPAR